MEKPKSRKPIIIVVLVVVLLVALFIAVYVETRPAYLYPQEIRDYQGENLSSIGDVQINAIKGVQYINQLTYRLTITGLVNRTVEETYEQVVNGHPQYKKIVTIYCVEGWNAKILWEGILVRDLLNDAGVNATAQAVIFHASDGYTTAMPLEYFMKNDILLAYKMNNLVIPPERGFPFELVAESKYGYKWIKWITSIELSDNVNYQGYWESRGFPNDANVP